MSVRKTSACDADKRPLWEKMRELADTGHPRAADLREFADGFEKANAAAFGESPPPDAAKKLLGHWARCRRLWCALTGEALIPGLTG